MLCLLFYCEKNDIKQKEAVKIYLREIGWMDAPVFGPQKYKSPEPNIVSKISSMLTLWYFTLFQAFWLF